MTDRHPLLDPASLDDLFMYRLTRLLAVAGAPVVRLCEGRFNITRREWRLIAALAQRGPLLSSALADHIHLERGRTSKAVSDLVAKGLVVRTPRPGDRRKVELALTEAARDIYAALFPEVIELNRALLAGLSAPELEALDRLMTHLQQRAEANLAGATLPKADRQRGRRRAGSHDDGP
ncbi:MAG: MarR family transcriptional regulator [Rhizobacter sp.]|nr:MarR family transcriptional regulator [Rhizobacter sp.]